MCARQAVVVGMSLFLLTGYSGCHAVSSAWWKSNNPAAANDLHEARKTSLAATSTTGPSIFNSLTNGLLLIPRGLAQAIGSFLPLRGLASLAADMGIPGADALLSFLTPRHHQPNDHRPSPRMMPSARRSGTSFDSSGTHKQHVSRTTDTDSNTFYYSPYLAELQSAMGAAHGDRECLLKLACLSGKRLSALSGASAVAILLASTTDFMPEAVREPYQAMKNSVMYSDDCSQYVCSKANPHQDL